MPFFITLLAIQPPPPILSVPVPLPRFAAPPAPPAPPLAANPPVLRNPGDVIRPKDYPRVSMRAGAEGAVRFEVGVSSKGKPVSCRIVEGSGDPDLDAQTCRSMFKRGKFSAGTDRNGRRVFGVMNRRVVWRLNQR